ncbi:MAG: diphosphomevalonate decarboxylase [Myxococcota bacterium]|nr:diphosphomevalonate decarboxylase [Myxococcota bacterium]
MATATVHPNIALVKYWGKRDRELNLPSTGSLSMTLSHYETRTSVRFGVDRDRVMLNGQEADDASAQRVLRHLDRIQEGRAPAEVISDNNFPTAAGLASSSSAFAALTLAAARDLGLDLTPAQLSALARQGSGSASRSLWGGFVEWRRGILEDGSDSHGLHIAPKDHWKLNMVIAVVDGNKKPVGSTEGMVRTMLTSPMYPAWVSTWQKDVDQARQAILDQDLQALGEAMERSTLKMFSTMFTAQPPIRYWRPASLAIQDEVIRLRRDGIPCWWTMDAGPNVKVLCEPEDTMAVVDALQQHVDEVTALGVGGPPVVED